tara:strand:+ start:292 stop:486 length:195 start_codon:yes stop_codon:yes gene_type:complete
MVKSPCVAVCKIDYESGYCIGCNRTTEEITNWSTMNDSNKKKILMRVKNNINFQLKTSSLAQND